MTTATTNGNGSINTNNNDPKTNGSNEIVLEPFIIDLFDDIAKKEGFSDYEIVPSAGSNHGDGFTGIMLRILMKGTRNGQPDILSLMLKMPPNGKARREQFDSGILFERESFMYRTILPMFAAFQREKGLDETSGFFAYPKCYAIVTDRTHDRYAIIMEDLKCQGYDMFNKHNVIDMEHVRLIMVELGKFHALSFALRDQKPDIFEPATLLEDVFLKMMIDCREMMESFQNVAFDRAISSLDDTELELRAKLETFKVNLTSHMEDCLGPMVAEPFSVLNHGDCWNNNMMYLYEASKTPKKICLIDFQISRFASPILDIVYFLFSSTVKSLRDQHFQDILKIYYTSLSTTIRKLGSNPDELFTFSDLEDQLKKFGKYGVLVAPMMLQVVTADPTDIPDLDKLFEDIATSSNENHLQTFISNKTEDLYNTRIRDVVRDAETYGFLKL